MGHVFISYVTEDAVAVRRLARALTAYGIEVWLDREQLEPGVRWASAIRAAIRDGAFFVACFSRHYGARQKTFMNEEITVAVEELRLHSTDHAWFLPVQLDDSPVPDRDIGAGETLRSLQWTKLYEDWDEGVSRLLRTIEPRSARLLELEVALRSDSARERIAALDDVARLGPHAARVGSALFVQLEHPNQTVRRAAVGALSRVAGPKREVVVALLTLIADRKDDHKPRDRYPYDAEAAKRCLAGFGADAVPVLLEAASAEARLVRPAAAVISEVSDRRATDRLVAELKNEQDAIRAASAGSLGRIFAPLGSYSNFLNDKLPINNIDTEHLPELHGAGVEAALLEVLTDREPSVRWNACFALGRIGRRASAATPHLVERLDDDSPWVRGLAAGALANIGDIPPEVKPRLIALLSDEHYVATRAAFALGSLGPAASDAVPSLIEHAERINEYQLYQALGAIGDPRAIPLLEKGTSHRHDTFRQVAITELAKFRAPERQA
ncbi:HEAT repeat domain-containing protein [Actinoplanes sp. TRM 88003]|uniref:HEAT repeat domain-containing protein n=1 Tax=Paractinoplanes aksuensis TaxID=2939490 RepID=A0ABT1DG30_9ACTN|nr:HEAT repeat domain-containing protein [Actinoplanes aksuensis]MCO8269791.1 HEAT repeat domain-containing protein [Actinoplanes aksuensis]